MYVHVYMYVHVHVSTLIFSGNSLLLHDDDVHLLCSG